MSRKRISAVLTTGKKCSQRQASRIEQPDSLEAKVVSLAKDGRFEPAVREAVAAQLARGLAVTYKQGKYVVKKHPSGRIQKLKKVRRTCYKLPPDVGRI